MVTHPNLNIRPFLPADTEAVMELFLLLSPQYFAPEEAAYLRHYLLHEREQYWVVEVSDEIIACGGINTQDSGRLGLLSWDLVHPHYQGKSVGSVLVNHRLAVLKAMPNIVCIRVRTSQHAEGFYAKQGFVTREIIPDSWAPGFDMVVMELT